MSRTGRHNLARQLRRSRRMNWPLVIRDALSAALMLLAFAILFVCLVLYAG